MMDIRFETLALQCRKGNEIIDLSAQVSFFHGKVSSGKSSIARLIYFCLGGHIERTPAIQQEVLSVTLELSVGKYRVLLERNCAEQRFVMATCQDEHNQAFTLSIPVTGSPTPLWADTVYNLSDLFFYLLGIEVIKIPVSRTKLDTGLVRLTLRNFMWYCYLDQTELDSSFFRHEDATKVRNSKEVFRYVLRYSTQEMVDLEARLTQYRRDRLTNISTAESLRGFLKRFGFSTEGEIEGSISATRVELSEAISNKTAQEQGYSNDTHVVDRLRVEIRRLIESIGQGERAVEDLEGRIADQEALRLELVSSKFKLAKNLSIANVFQGVGFHHCPACGTNVQDRPKDPDHCQLCGSDVGNERPEALESAQTVKSDLDDRVAELEQSIDYHKKSLVKTKRDLSILNIQRAALDGEMQADLQTYESIFLSNIRKIDQTVATLNERIAGLERLMAMPQEISRLEEAAADLAKMEEQVKIQLTEARRNLSMGDRLVNELEDEFLSILLRVGVPGVSEEDRVVINRKNWDVMIWPKGEEWQGWNFYNAGSGGKKTLFNSCFVLALHVVAARNDLPLPTFIIIDTPMKNIDKEVNQAIFRHFYDYVYLLATTVLDRTQFILIDNNFIPPPMDMKISFFDRRMDADDPNYPPLISYYAGP